MHLSNSLALWATAALSLIGVLLIPTLVFIVRGAVKWTRVEDRLGAVAKDLSNIVTDKDKVHRELTEKMADDNRAHEAAHQAMVGQMAADRAQTDRRLRYIEEFWMEQGRRGFPIPRGDAAGG